MHVFGYRPSPYDSPKTSVRADLQQEKQNRVMCRLVRPTARLLIKSADSKRYAENMLGVVDRGPLRFHQIERVAFHSCHSLSSIGAAYQSSAISSSSSSISLSSASTSPRISRSSSSKSTASVGSCSRSGSGSGSGSRSCSTSGAI